MHFCDEPLGNERSRALIDIRDPGQIELSDRQDGSCGIALMRVSFEYKVVGTAKFHILLKNV